ncbi:hypothetical protein JCM8115_000479 [Rhodotorula mucilaginosa]
MESLGQLNTALPPNELAEQALASSFRQAALSITALFKQGKRATTKAYIAGQRQALQEVLEFMQAMLDHSGNQSGSASSHSLPAGSGASGAATSLGQVDGSRLINFICARQEALKAEEEDYDEEEVSGPGSGSTAVPPRRAASAAPAVPTNLRPSMPFGTRSEGATRAASPTPRTVPTGLPTAAASTNAVSTSSAPPSPTSSLAFSPPFTRSTASLFRPTSNLAPSAPPPAAHSHSAPPASPSPLGPTHPSSLATGNPPSPLGRPSRLHRDHHHHHRTRNSSRSNGVSATGSAGGTGTKATQLMPTGPGLSAAAAGDESTSAGVKRRWAREAVGFGGGGGDQGGGDAEVVEVHAADDESAAGRDGMDVEPMADLEGWDGIGERPPKRTMRSARVSAAAAESSARAANTPPSNES